MIKIGFLLNFPLEYKGGINYFKNLFYAVDKYYQNEIKIVLFVPQNIDEDYIDMFDQYVQIVRTSILQRKSLKWFISRIGEKYLGFDLLVYRLLQKHQIQCISHSNYVSPSKLIKSINWIPDFQYIHYPDLWKKGQLISILKFHRKLIRTSDRIIVSSNSAKQDLKINNSLYIDKVRVLHFVSQPEIKNTPNQKTDISQYVNGKYFYLPNQFWSHKNHLIVFKAISILKNKGINIHLITSGLMRDYRKSKAIKPLLSFVKDNGLEDNIKFLGLIRYPEVLQLITNSRAVINPSFFEGWSSTVEEAKSIGKKIILSDIGVHREQAPKTGVFFNPNNAVELSQILEDLWNNDDIDENQLSDQQIADDLETATYKFANDFREIIGELFI